MIRQQTQDLLSVLEGREELTANNVRMLKLFMKEWDVSLFDAIIETKILSEGRLADIICEHYGYKRLMSIEQETVVAEVRAKIPYMQARKLHCLALCQQDDGCYQVVMCDPTTRDLHTALKTHLNATVVPLISTRSEVNAALSSAYAPEEQFSGV